jgi:hypothetical protein
LSEAVPFIAIRHLRIRHVNLTITSHFISCFKLISISEILKNEFDRNDRDFYGDRDYGGDRDGGNDRDGDNNDGDGGGDGDGDGGW